MKVPAVTFNSVNTYNPDMKNSGSASLGKYSNSRKNIDDLSGMPYVYPISFTSIQNSSKLRALFAYNLPCMYTGIPMIDPKVLSRMLKNNLFNRPAGQVLEALSRYKDSFGGMEAKCLEIIKERSAIHPDKTIKELIKEIEPVYKRRLRKKQAPIFHELSEAAHELPDKYRYKFRLLMADTDKKLNEKPVLIPFSSYEFKYKLSKIKDDIVCGQDIKAKKVMNKLIKESKKFSNSTNAHTIENQKNVINFMEIILRKSVLKDNVPLKNLIDISKSRLIKEEIIVPFSKKNFIYDLARLIEDLPDNRLQEKLITIAQKLPTSQESFSAYILKLAADTPEKIGHRLVWPSLASVEHILPHSEGGKDMLANFGGATTRANSARKSIPFVQQMQICPQTAQNCQRYVDKLIELYHAGVFARHNVSPKYIVDFKNTIYTQSKHKLNLDISKLYKKNALNSNI